MNKEVVFPENLEFPLTLGRDYYLNNPNKFNFWMGSGKFSQPIDIHDAIGGDYDILLYAFAEFMGRYDKDLGIHGFFDTRDKEWSNRFGEGMEYWERRQFDRVLDHPRRVLFADNSAAADQMFVRLLLIGDSFRVLPLDEYINLPFECLIDHPWRFSLSPEKLDGWVNRELEGLSGLRKIQDAAMAGDEVLWRKLLSENSAMWPDPGHKLDPRYVRGMRKGQIAMEARAIEDMRNVRMKYLGLK